MKNHSLVVAAALCAPAFLSSQARASVLTTSEELIPISTDRPGFLFAPTVLTEGRFQVEAGLPTYTLFDEGGVEATTWSLPVALRYGLTQTLELRASVPTWNDVSVESGGSTFDDDGFGDVEVGAKLALSQASDTPLAVMASFRLPTGDDGFSSESLGASGFLLHGRSIGNDFTLNSMAGVTYTPVDGSDDLTFATIGALLAHPIAEKWSGYVEAVALPGIQNVAGQAYAGAGLIWNPRYDLQFDLSADFGLEEDSSDVIAAFGISYAF
jgi:hypothetical protein